MKKGQTVVLAAIIVASLVLSAVSGYAAQFKIAIMQDSAGEARKFKPLLEYLNKKGISAEFVGAKDYSAAAAMFAKGEVDAMFSGSGVAGAMIIKGVADPVVRPVSQDGISTYWAVIIARKGSPKFNDSIEYFKGKKVIFTSLASSGEFYFRSIGGAKAGVDILKAASHGAAIDALDRGQADIAIVKNRVWDKEKNKYPRLEMVGEDHEENPDGTLIVSKRTDTGMVNSIAGILLGLKGDSSADAAEVKKSLGIQGYVKTTSDNFKHTLSLLQKAGVTKSFDFK